MQTLVSTAYCHSPLRHFAALYVTLALSLALEVNISRFKQFELPMLFFSSRGLSQLKIETPCFQSGCLPSYAVILTCLQMRRR